MVILYTPKIDLPLTLGWIHEATTWYLATDPTFTDDSIVASSIEDTDNLTSVILDYDTIPDVTYYAKARIICNKSIFESDVGIVKTTDFIKIAFDYPIPSLVMKPTITLDFDYKNTPSSMFRITTTSMSTTSNGKHEATSYIIETLDGSPVFSELFNKDDLTSKLMDDTILESNRSYILKVSHHSTSNDSSEFAEQVFTVLDNNEIILTTNIIDRDVDNGLDVIIQPINNFSSMKVDVYASGLSDSVNTFTSTDDSLTMVVPSTAFDKATNIYLLAITITKTNGDIIGPRYHKVTTN